MPSNAAPNWAEVAQVVLGVIGLATVIVGILTLRKTDKQNAIANVLACEDRIETARNRFSAAMLRVGATHGKSDEEARLDSKALGEALESYLNSVDRLCAAILRDDITEEVYRADYRPLINETMQRYKEKLGVGSVHRNILKLFGRWADN